MKIALVHDHLAQDGGAERVLRVFQEMYPKAPTYVLLYDKTKADRKFLEKDIRTSYLQNFPLGLKRYQWALPFMPNAVESYDLSGYDLVISSSSMFAKGIIVKPHTTHICYCHTPTRFLWSDTLEYVNKLSFNKILKKIIGFVLTDLRIWDKISADRPDFFIANSSTVKHRINKYYKKESTVIYPPVDVDNYKISNTEKKYFLAGGRIVYYKRFDLIIEAFRSTEKRLKIFGTGPLLEKLKKIAPPNVEFLENINEDKKRELFSECLAFINPQEEDLGITMIEALAAGRPVIAYKKGGACEIIKEGETGEFFEEQTPKALVKKVTSFDSSKYNSQEIKEYAQKFSVKRFKDEINNFVKEKLN